MAVTLLLGRRGLWGNCSLGQRMLGTSHGLSLKIRPREKDFFKAKAVEKASEIAFNITFKLPIQVAKEDGVSQDFSLIYREVNAFKYHKNFQLAGVGSVLSMFYFDIFNKSLVNSSLLIGICLLISFYNLRVFYRVPLRLYYSHKTSTYRIVLNRLNPLLQPVKIDFLREEITKVFIQKQCKALIFKLRPGMMNRFFSLIGQLLCCL